MFDVGITNFFFFRDAEKELGKANRVSFFDYFKVTLWRTYLALIVLSSYYFV